MRDRNTKHIIIACFFKIEKLLKTLRSARGAIARKTMD
ncbi:hypothetical protein CKA32_006776 [Geitlerinema sp. FC II]|nr:hypothetical protein CKA32_006776 [Geitlerinema sp. FC II]